MLTYAKVVEKNCMYKKINVNKLTEGDWITESIYHKGKLIYNKNSPGVTKQEISIIKRIKQNVIVKEGIPFIPAFLIAFLVTIIIGNLFMGF